MLGKLFWTMPRWSWWYAMFGGERERVAPADDALLAQVGRPPVHFQRELVGADDLGRIGKVFTDLREKGEVAVRGRVVVAQRGVGQLLRAARRRALHELSRARVVPRLRTHRLRERAAQRGPTRGPQDREDSAHDWKMSLCVRGAASARRTGGNAMTTFDRFKALAVRGGLVPVWRDCLLDGETPVSAFAKLRRGPFAFLLESAPAGGETWARYTFMGTEPRGAWRLTDGVAEDWTPDKGWHGARTPADPLADLQRARSRSTSRWTCRSSVRSGAAPSAFSRTTSRGTSRDCRTLRRARSPRPMRCSCSRTRS